MDQFSLLFVDDEEEFLDTIEEFFASLGYVVYTARNGQEGLLRVKEHLPRAVFLDISMPHMDGTETLRLIREIDNDSRYRNLGLRLGPLGSRALAGRGVRLLSKTRGSDATSRGRIAAAHHARPGLIYFYYTDLEKWYNQA